jgi:hypothetical protein
MEQEHWRIESELFSQDGKRFARLIPDESKALLHAEELSEEHKRHSFVVINPSGHWIAEYKNGVEQMEKLTLQSLTLNCKIYAEHLSRSRMSPLACLLWIAAAVCSWSALVAWLYNHIGNIFVALVLGGAVIAGIGKLISVGIEKQYEAHHEECEKWVLWIARSVMRMQPEVRDRLLRKAYTNNPGWQASQPVVEKFRYEIETLHRAGYE